MSKLDLEKMRALEQYGEFDHMYIYDTLIGGVKYQSNDRVEIDLSKAA